MAKCEIIDTFPAFLAYWTKAQDKPVDAQVETWASDYMSQWPELLEKQLEDYASQDEDRRQIARERVFPFLDDRLPAMKAAHKNLLEICEPTYSAAQEALGFESDVIFVIYVGIGCGAGWVTRFHDSPAVLFGLENVTECGWSQPQPITGLVAHEIGHLVHEHWRAQHGQAEGSGPWWQLYCEGFAQRCEHVILSRETWHMRGGDYGDDWLDWCQEQKSWLAAEFLRLVDEGESIRPFFGSWFEVRGRKQCGYFLGHELVKQLATSMSLKEIALLDSKDARLRYELERLAQSAQQASIKREWTRRTIKPPQPSQLGQPIRHYSDSWAKHMRVDRYPSSDWRGLFWSDVLRRVLTYKFSEPAKTLEVSAYSTMTMHLRSRNYASCGESWGKLPKSGLL